MEILSQLWSLLGLLTVIQNILPSQILSLLHSLYESISDTISPYTYFDVPEFNGYCGVDLNHLYRHVTLYLSSLGSDPSTSSSSSRLTLSRAAASSGGFTVSVAANHSVRDSFIGHQLTWTHHVETLQDSLDEKRSFILRLPKHHVASILRPYLQRVTSRAEEFERLSRDRRLFTNNGNGSYESGWVSVPFRHPSTFETLALEPELKRQITEDLTAFANGKEWYHSVGRTWKRGYLLYGTPGTGKSSLIAAMANYLRYDVYDLELTKVTDNSELRALLIQTTNRSIVVIEDIDCSVDLTAERVSRSKRHLSNRRVRSSCDRENEEDGRVTLSGLLNFTDGLWSCCGEERIIVFTTNHRDNVDPALVRRGRMDVHVSLGACGTSAFRTLAKNYLGVESHPMLEAAEKCIRSGGALTPAQVGEILLRNRGDADVALNEVVAAMQAKILGGETAAVDSDYHNAVGGGGFSPRSVLIAAAGSPPPSPGKKMKFLVRLRSLTKSDSCRRGASQ